MADDLGYGDISPYDGWIETPALERMTAEGMRLTDYHSSGNVCSPTRAGLMTGRYQQRAGIPGVVVADPKQKVHEHGLQDRELTLPEVLKQHGYFTAIYGKWHLGYERKYNPVRHGFDEFVGYVSGNIDFISHYDQAGNFDWWHNDKPSDEAGYTTHLIDRHAKAFIRKHTDEPFFLYLPHEAPHYPFQRPDDPGRRSEGQGNRADEKLDKEQVRERYKVMVQEMDRSIGEILDLLDELNLSERTLVIFVSDNGAAGKYGDNSPLRGAKGSNWEGGHRVPGIFRWTGKIEAGSERAQLAISLDLMPTILAAAKIESPSDRPLDGVDLLPQLLGQKLNKARKLYWNGHAMRDASWKLMEGGKGVDGAQLYNLADDLGESTDVSSQHPERVAEMRAALKAWREDVAKDATPQP